MQSLDVGDFVERQADTLRSLLKGERALIAVSGGVDSTVSALIAHRGIGENLVCVFIDHNFMRLGEPEQVAEVLSGDPLNLPVKVVDARERFMKALHGLEDAEFKRKAFRETFYSVLGEIAKQEGCRFLVQGTIRADVEETRGQVKTQHNVLEQIGIDPVSKFGFTVVEPVASLYKNQVREVARFLGAPKRISERQPFPGPGLSVRVVGVVTQEKLDELRRATDIVERHFSPFAPDQYFAAIFEGKSLKAPDNIAGQALELLRSRPATVTGNYLREKGTGVNEGKRAYGWIAAIEAYGMDGTTLLPEYQTLESMRRQIQNNAKDITRILCLISGRQEAGFWVALRAIVTKDYLTADIAKIQERILTAAATEILEGSRKISKVFLDITPKPPGTIEFE